MIACDNEVKYLTCDATSCDGKYSTKKLFHLTSFDCFGNLGSFQSLIVVRLGTRWVETPKGSSSSASFLISAAGQTNNAFPLSPLDRISICVIKRRQRKNQLVNSDDAGDFKIPISSHSRRHTRRFIKR